MTPQHPDRPPHTKQELNIGVLAAKAITNWGIPPHLAIKYATKHITNPETPMTNPNTTTHTEYALQHPDGAIREYGDQDWVRSGQAAQETGGTTIQRTITTTHGPWTPTPNTGHATGPIQLGSEATDLY